MKQVPIKRKKISRKVFFIFLWMCLFMAVVLGIMNHRMNRQDIQMLEVLRKDFQNLVHHTLSSVEESTRLYLQDITAWDELIESISRKDTNWMQINIGLFAQSQGVNELRIFSAEPRQLYIHQNVTREQCSSLPVDMDSIPELFAKSPFIHFFRYWQGTLFEYFGGPVVPSENILNRQAIPSGYILFNRVWDSTFINKLKESTEAAVFLTTSSYKPKLPDPADLYCPVMITGIDGRQLAVLNFFKYQESLSITLRRNRLTYGMLIGGMFLALFLAWVLIDRSLSRPVKSLAAQLQGLETTGLSKMIARDDEFSILSKQVLNSIVLRKTLDNEIEERKLRENQLKELNETKDRIFSIIGHDLISPFNTIFGLSELLENTGSANNPEKVREFARMIRATSREAYQVLETLLTWGRMQSGMIVCKPARLDLQVLIEDAVILARSQAKLKGIAISNKIDSSLMVMADPTMISTVIRNLVSNAIKFTPHGGSIVLLAGSSGINAMVQVSDSGIGMSKDKLDSLFIPEKANPERGTANEKGTGLGLILCHDMVHLNQGEIWAESSLGKGTVFSFTLPLA